MLKLKWLMLFCLGLSLFACSGGGNSGSFIPPGGSTSTGGTGGSGGGSGGGGGGGSGTPALTLTGTSPRATSTEANVIFTFAGSNLSGATAVSLQRVDSLFDPIGTPLSLTLNTVNSTSISATLNADETIPTGSYQIRVTLPSGPISSAFVLSLFNFVINFENATQGVFIGSTGGAGTLTPLPNYLAAGFVNNDGFPDLVVAGGDDVSNLTSLYYGLGDGTFSLSTFTSIPTADGFGKVALEPSPAGGFAPDAVRIGTEDPEVQFLPSTGTGASIGFSTPSGANRKNVNTLAGVGSTGNIPTAVLFERFSGDALPDVLVTLNGTPNNAIHKVLMLENGLGTTPASFPFADAAVDVVNISLGGLTGPTEAAAGDFDGTGVNSLDVVVINSLASNFTPIFFDATGTPTVQTPITTAGIPTGVDVGDFNGDGSLDVAISSVSGPQAFVEIFINDGTGGFTDINNPFTITGILSALVVADFNQDDFDDIAVASTDGKIEIFFSSFEDLDSPFAFYRATVPLSDTPDEIFVHIIAVDWDLDGKMDLGVSASTPVGLTSPTDVFTLITR